ncbi:sigma-54-dependent Fis family transcriptional regulator [Fodinicola acaciae]|uniref:sigma-54-dependent Fis family transcriptional regulator n=1 Tax=Fodinicola acaciae TaxID=2681555 RepID=UPI001C9E8B37|nr:GAF domain-containing protein [Fodinicola acaciae]
MEDARNTLEVVAPDDPALARARLRFLTAEPFERSRVRLPILASWNRSVEFRVPADRLAVPYVRDKDVDTPLVRAAEPVLERLAEQLDGQPISIILTDPTGIVLTQRTGDPDLHRHLERVELVPGFSYGEKFVGTNGIGTALEDGQPTHVFGHEHYAENLENLACAGAPITHPISGKVIGAVDLTCWSRDAGPLMVALAKTTAEQIRQAVRSNTRELALFEAYLRTCRRTTGIVMAFNEEVVMANDAARRLLAPADQSMLLGQVTHALSDRRPAVSVVALPTGGRVRLQTRPVPGPRYDEVAGVVVSAKLVETDEERTESPAVQLPVFLPGVVGSAPQWLRCCHDVDASYGRGEWLVLAGEAGVGKYTLARCVHQRRSPTGRMHTLDALDADFGECVRRDLLDDPVDALVIRHVDRLSAGATASLVSLLRKVDGSGTWIAVTMSDDTDSLSELISLFPRTVRVPPLRRHVEDMTQLIPLFLNRLSPRGQLRCSPAAMHLLMRANWDGNATELHQVLKQVAQHRRTGIIRPADLPTEYRTVNRRQLNRIESMERDAIVDSLDDAGGNKVRAAQLLGMSRATLYRKIHEYGIVTPDR